jgi:glutathione synthase/RimK-type ligase-like ATP-grasp enzyme
MKIALATCRAWPDLLDSDLELQDALKRRGHIVEAAPWNGPIEAFTNADAVVLRACWDYSENPLAFLDWLECLEKLGKPVRNDPDIVRSNFDKSYLLDLADAGFRVPKTFVVDPHDRGSIEEAFDKTGWEEAVLKPVSGQSGFGVSKIKKAQPELWRGDAIVTGKALLQEFQADIGELGETTLTFFGGHFSHAVLRVIARDDWRANSQYGSHQELTSVSPEVVDQAKSALAVAAPSHVYARVDGIIRDNQLTVMEIELIEPTLYLHLAPGAADRFAEAVERSLA